MVANIIIYTGANCSYCTWAKNLLDAKNLPYQEIRIDLDEKKRVEMEQLSGRRTVPQIFINDQHIGGFDDLSALAKSGKLESLLESKK
jgi:glutaredoxin 3